MVEDHEGTVSTGKYSVVATKIASFQEYDDNIRPLLKELKIRPINFMWTRRGMSINFKTAEEAILFKLYCEF